VGVDGQTGEDYAADLEGNLRSLLERAKSGTYQAPPVRRVHIPKAGSSNETRPLGVRPNNALAGPPPVFLSADFFG
jgi:retron-type reverse transcriptase